MNRFFLTVSLVFILFLAAAAGSLPPASHAGQAESAVAPSNSGVRLLTSAESGLVLELTTPGYDVAAETLPAGAFHRLTVPEYGVTGEAGKPQLPMASALLGVPPNVEIELHVLADEAVELPGRFKLLPAPAPAPLMDDLQPGEQVYEPDPTTYASDALYPRAPARIAGDAWLRDQRVVRVELYPFQYQPVQGVLLWHRRLRVEVRFVGTPAPTPGPSPNSGGGESSAASPSPNPSTGLRTGFWGGKLDSSFFHLPSRVGGGRGRAKRRARGERANPFEQVLRRALINYDTARAWRGRPAPGTKKPGFSQKPGFSSAESRYKITVDRDGLYRITYAELEAAGMDVDRVDPRTFHLTSQGEDAAIEVAGEGDGRFDPGDAITFFGQKFRGERLAELYADEMADWLTLCPKCELAGIFEKYTDENVYWLTAGGEPGPRMGTVDGSPTDTAPAPDSYRATVRVEQSHEWYTHHFTNEDTWFWERIQPGPADATRTYTTTLTALATGSYSATVRASVVSRSSNAGHHTQFYLNDSPAPLDDALWDGVSRHTVEAQVPQSQLREGVNELRFAVLYNGAFEDLYFDWFEIEYARRFQAEENRLAFSGQAGGRADGPWQYAIDGFTDPNVRIYDVGDPLAPKRVLNGEVAATPGNTHRVTFEASHDAGARFLTVADSAVQQPKSITRRTSPDLRSPDNGADYIVITHETFRDAVQRLADYRAAQGLRVKVVDVADVYDEFNFGIYHPIAIRNFLAYAYANWQPPAPSYVVLVGDGHWNLKGYRTERYGEPAPIYMPPNLSFVDPWQGEVDSANLLAAVVGDDIMPDLAIGRLPVNGVAELDAVVDKIIAYEGADLEDWQQRALFVADNVPDSAGDFVTLADDIIANHLPADIEADRVYVNDYCGAPGNPPQPCPAVNDAIVEQLSETGALLVSYIGHASVERWAHERVFVTEDVPALDNGGRLPVMLSMTCLDGYWLFPNRAGLAEELLRREGAGAVSTFSPTGLGVATGHHVMQGRLYDAVFQDGVGTLGPATLAAKTALFEAGWSYDLIHTFTIFGDPALRLRLPPATVYLPLIAR